MRIQKVVKLVKNLHFHIGRHLYSAASLFFFNLQNVCKSMLQGREVLGFLNATETGPQSLSGQGRGRTFRSQRHTARVRLGLRGHNTSSTLIWIEGSPLTMQPVSERLEEEECRDRQSSMEGRGVGQGLLRGVGYVSALSQSASSSIWEGRQPQRTRQARERADGCACVTLLIVNAL